MRDNRALKTLGLKDEEIELEVAAAAEGIAEAELAKAYEDSIKNFQVDTIIKGKIVGVVGERVLVDVGYKSEGEVLLNEFPRPGEVKPGDPIEVFLESVEGETGLIALSKAKADRIRGWERIILTNKEGDTVRGRVIRKIKGGLLVDVGVPVFLPASQVDIRRVDDIGEYLGREIECKIIKIDERRMNIIVSRRRLLEEQREELKKKLLAEIKQGEVRRGLVKNIADFGVFIDLGGIDGLLHITDMCWGRISHPSEMVALDQPLDVKILKVDLERERIALGLKQLTPSPWEQVPLKYPPGTKVRGRVVNMLPYGAFVELETGVEGLVHVSEMSWTKRINNPSEVVAIGDTVDVVVLSVNTEKQEISLGMKQVEANPWTLLEKKYPAGT
ncbi:MAG: S1 RNA-binding domain-containing protein, partial [Planctomycetota bacterium]|nr:S1 RNA-binding domain-containing protein [Planctomycetota bacterium]